MICVARVGNEASNEQLMETGTLQQLERHFTHVVP